MDDDDDGDDGGGGGKVGGGESGGSKRGKGGRRKKTLGNRESEDIELLPISGAITSEVHEDRDCELYSASRRRRNIKTPSHLEEEGEEEMEEGIKVTIAFEDEICGGGVGGSRSHPLLWLGASALSAKTATTSTATTTSSSSRPPGARAVVLTEVHQVGRRTRRKLEDLTGKKNHQHQHPKNGVNREDGDVSNVMGKEEDRIRRRRRRRRRTASGHGDKTYLRETEELDYILSITDKEDRNWLEASADLDDDKDTASSTSSSSSSSFFSTYSYSSSSVASRHRTQRQEVTTTVDVHSVLNHSDDFIDCPRFRSSPASSSLSSPVTPANSPTRDKLPKKKSSVSVIKEKCDSRIRRRHPSLQHAAKCNNKRDAVVRRGSSASMRSSLKSKSASSVVSQCSPASRLSLAASATNCSLEEEEEEEEEEDLGSLLGPEREQVLGEKIRSLVTQFRGRADRVKQRLEHPPSPEFASEEDEDEAAHKSRALRRVIFEDFDAALYSPETTRHWIKGRKLKDLWSNLRQELEFIDPRGYINIAWLALQALVFLYNAWVIPLRFFFPAFRTDLNLSFWLLCDYLADALCFFDLLVYKHRVLFMESGFWVRDRTRITAHYVREGPFVYDLLSLLPSDLLYLHLGVNFTLVRLPRVLKVVDFWEFIYRLDSVLAKPYLLRIVKTVNYMLYLIHLNACAYHAISEYEGIASNTFVYNGVGDAYVRCFFFATKTATSIGKNNKPTNIPEILFMTTTWLIGVFVFALLIGDVRDIVSSARRNETTYQRQMDAIGLYMSKNKVNRRVQGRIRMWLDYTWKQQNSFDETAMLRFLPPKMRTDIAMRVHYQTLMKVKLFRDCEPGLLKDLVVLLRPIIYLPGDHVCDKDDVGKEMFIIQSGLVRVMGGLDGRTVLCQLAEGSVFGEIALLGVDGMNRRTADVVSVGFSNLFVLQKEDLEKVLKDYPDAKRILNSRARKLMKENAARLQKEHEELKKRKRRTEEGDDDGESNGDAELIFPLTQYPRKQSSPALLSTVLKVLPAASRAARLLREGSRGIAVISGGGGGGGANLSLPGSRSRSPEGGGGNLRRLAFPLTPPFPPRNLSFDDRLRLRRPRRPDSAGDVSKTTTEENNGGVE